MHNENSPRFDTHKYSCDCINSTFTNYFSFTLGHKNWMQNKHNLNDMFVFMSHILTLMMKSTELLNSSQDEKDLNETYEL